MLDVNAILVETGQTIWFYRFVKTELPRTDNTVKVLATQRDGAWVLENPEVVHTREERRLRSGEIEAVSIGARSTQEEEATYFALVREVVHDFVGQFASGAGGSAPPPNLAARITSPLPPTIAPAAQPAPGGAPSASPPVPSTPTPPPVMATPLK
jgi:hypothetical protein